MDSDEPAPASQTVPLGKTGLVARDDGDWRGPFHREVDDLFRRRLRVAAGVFAVLHGSSFLVFDDPMRSKVGAAIRIGLLPLTALLFASTFWQPAVKWVRVLSMVTIATIAGYAAWTNATMGDPLDIRALTLTILAAGLLFPFGWRAILALSTIILGFYYAATRLARDATPQAIGGGVFFLVGASALATVAALLSSRLREREFQARHQAESLLKNMLPEQIVARLKGSRGAVADRHEEATVMFVDIVGFTVMSAAMTPERLVRFLNDLFQELDALTTREGLEKIKTIGDAYMVAGGLPAPRKDHAEAVARLALAMRDLVAGLDTPTGQKLSVRIGIHTGPVIAGVIGATKLTYDLWGDTVNTASRMESHGEPGMIQVSRTTYDHLGDRYRFEPRGTIQVKGKGAMETFALLGAKGD
jgi:class 3 adenylate cyclase